MITTDHGFPAVDIVIPSGTLARYITFEISIERLMVPPGTSLARLRGPTAARNRNIGVRVLKNPYVWLIDDDHEFDPDVLLRLLLRHADLAKQGVPEAAVAAFTTFKTPPWQPVIFAGIEDDPHDGGPTCLPVSWDTVAGRTGLYRVWACNVSGMLLPRAVFDRMARPWFRVGTINPESAMEDIAFCQALGESNVPLYVDLDTTLGHLHPVSSRPRKGPDGSWCMELHWGDEDRLLVPLIDRVALSGEITS